MKPLKVAISTVGCRANQADSAALLRLLDRTIIELCNETEEADVVIINTCTVTGEADRDSRKRVRRALKISPNAKVFVIGCAVNINRHFGEDTDNRAESLSFDTGSPQSLACKINAMAGSMTPEKTTPEKTDLGIDAGYMGRTRGMLKIQTGCSHGCSYCIVPKARGKERSMKQEDALDEINRLKDLGYNEVVITGVQLGAWGKEIVKKNCLAEVLSSLADSFAPGRIRISSLEPWSADDTLLKTVLQHPRICPHLHLPLQHGDDRILEAMRRGYKAKDYLAIVEKIKKINPKAALGTDIILGFPGEDETAFNNLLKILKQIEPSYLHAFSFSPRKGTMAATMENRPSKETARLRTSQVRELGSEFSQIYIMSHLEQTREVIIEELKGEETLGLTDTFVKVKMGKTNLNKGELVKVKFTAADKDSLNGCIEDK